MLGCRLKSKLLELVCEFLGFGFVDVFFGKHLAPICTEHIGLRGRVIDRFVVHSHTLQDTSGVEAGPKLGLFG
jgi:hypothetical protein